MHMRRTAAISASLILFALVGCQKKGPIPAAPKPIRPKPVPIEVSAPAPVDCKPTVIAESPPAVPYKQRVIVESKNLSTKGDSLLSGAIKGGVKSAEQEQMFREGVEDLITALKADPYNVDATYDLARAYAFIHRSQCSINLLERLALLRKLDSHTADVEKKIDRLLGRGRYRGRLDSAFDDMRAAGPFRAVVEKLIAPMGGQS